MSEEIVQRAMRELLQGPAAPLPDAKRIWWLAEIRRRQEARMRVMRIMRRVRIATSAAAFLGAGGVAVWQGADLPGLVFLAGASVVCAAIVAARAVLIRE